MVDSLQVQQAEYNPACPAAASTEHRWPLDHRRNSCQLMRMYRHQLCINTVCHHCSADRSSSASSTNPAPLSVICAHHSVADHLVLQSLRAWMLCKVETVGSGSGTPNSFAHCYPCARY